MLADQYGHPVSTASAAARDAYVAGVDGLLAARAGVAEHLERAAATDPSFALAHIALARSLFLDAEVGRARAAATRARERVAGASARERSHVNALALAIEGRPVDALDATRTHLAEWPRDAMVLAPATGVFGLIGFSGRPQREDELYDLLHGLAPYYGDDWWFGTAYAFAACETGRLGEARCLIDASLASNPGNAHGAHVLAHVLYETGETAHALAFLDDWLKGYDRRGLMHCHLSWHRALSALALGRTDLAWDAYRCGVHPGAAWGPPINVATDAVAFLWRSELAGQPRRPGLWHELHEYTQRAFPKAGLPFIDVHAELAATVSGAEDALDRMLAIAQRIAAGRYPAGDVVPLIAKGLAAYAREDWNAAIEALAQALPQTVRIGGSRAQRDLVEDTLLAATLKAGRIDDARARLARRGERQPMIDLTALAAASAPAAPAELRQQRHPPPARAPDHGQAQAPGGH
jgi:hypothetical protein